jgi:hypothetical protein
MKYLKLIILFMLSPIWLSIIGLCFIILPIKNFSFLMGKIIDKFEDYFFEI